MAQGGPRALCRGRQRREARLPDITILYWRDIPAQVIAGRGRAAAKVVLAPRFEAAIDRAAMRSGAQGEADYLAQWRRASAGAREGEPSALAHALARQIEADYDEARLAALVAHAGRG